MNNSIGVPNVWKSHKLVKDYVTIHARAIFLTKLQYAQHRKDLFEPSLHHTMLSPTYFTMHQYKGTQEISFVSELILEFSVPAEQKEGKVSKSMTEPCGCDSLNGLG
jgi:hypothetical protein